MLWKNRTLMSQPGKAYSICKMLILSLHILDSFVIYPFTFKPFIYFLQEVITIFCGYYQLVLNDLCTTGRFRNVCSFIVSLWLNDSNKIVRNINKLLSQSKSLSAK